MNVQQLGEFVVNCFTSFSPSLFEIIQSQVNTTGVNVKLVGANPRRRKIIFTSTNVLVPVTTMVAINGDSPKNVVKSIPNAASLEFTWIQDFSIVQQEFWIIGPPNNGVVNITEVLYNSPFSRGITNAIGKLKGIADKIPIPIFKRSRGGKYPQPNNTR